VIWWLCTFATPRRPLPRATNFVFHECALQQPPGFASAQTNQNTRLAQIWRDRAAQSRPAKHGRLRCGPALCCTVTKNRTGNGRFDSTDDTKPATTILNSHGPAALAIMVRGVATRAARSVGRSRPRPAHTPSSPTRGHPAHGPRDHHHQGSAVSVLSEQGFWSLVLVAARKDRDRASSPSGSPARSRRYRGRIAVRLPRPETTPGELRPTVTLDFLSRPRARWLTFTCGRKLPWPQRCTQFSTVRLGAAFTTRARAQPHRRSSAGQATRPPRRSSVMRARSSATNRTDRRRESACL